MTRVDGPGPAGTAALDHAAPKVVRFQDVHEKAAAYMTARQLVTLQRAYVFSAKAHEGQSRLSGEPYLVHPLAVAEILADWRMDAVTVAAGLMHDILEDTAVSADEIERLFGKEVANLVDGVTKLSKLAFSTKEEAQAESFRKMILAMADDLRVILVKLADRLHNMRTLGYLPPEKQVAVARETGEIYAPIAHRLGMGRLKSELDDLAFRHSEPETYQRLSGELEQRRPVEEGFIREVEEKLRAAMSAAGIPARVMGRRKSLTSIRRKLLARGIGIEEVHDYIAFRILVDSVHDCYAALGVIHSTWTPIQARFKDLIAMPKPNGYRSIHTTLMSASGPSFEVQIRTHEMNLVAEEGVAAHWGYKEGATPSTSEAQRFAWLRNLLDALRDHADPKEFMAAVKMDLYGEEVYCFTPKGEVKVLPAGSTPIDFAYAIHTEVGHHCFGARIDGVMVPMRSKLSHGNRVEILTSTTQKPSRDWLQFVTTSRARSKIRQWFNAHDREMAIDAGRTLLEREARRAGTSLRRLVQSRETRAVLKQLGFREPEDLYVALAHDRVQPATFIAKVQGADPQAGPAVPRPAPARRAPPPPPAEPGPPSRKGRKSASRGPVVVGEGGAMLWYLARCCKPVRGEEILGYVTRGRGVAVHRADCRSLTSGGLDEARFLPVSWDRESATTFDVKLRVDVADRPGMLNDVTGVLAGLETNIRGAEARSGRGKGSIALVVEVSDAAHLERICRALRRIDGVRAVER